MMRLTSGMGVAGTNCFVLSSWTSSPPTISWNRRVTVPWKQSGVNGSIAPKAGAPTNIVRMASRPVPSSFDQFLLDTRIAEQSKVVALVVAQLIKEGFVESKPNRERFHDRKLEVVAGLGGGFRSESECEGLQVFRDSLTRKKSFIVWHIEGLSARDTGVQSRTSTYVFELRTVLLLRPSVPPRAA